MSDAYPLKVVYCGNCGLPPEFCVNGVKFESCKPWLRANVPDMYPELAGGGADAGGAGGSGDAADAAAAGVAALTVKDEGSDSDSGSGSDSSEDDAPKKKSHRGGQVQRGGAKKKGGPGAVVITKKDRGRKKYVTTISGLDGYDHLKLKEVASALGKRFGAGATVTKSAEGKPEVDVQGDLCYELEELLPTLFGIPEDAIIVKS